MTSKGRKMMSVAAATQPPAADVLDLCRQLAGAGLVRLCDRLMGMAVDREVRLLRSQEARALEDAARQRVLAGLGRGRSPA